MSVHLIECASELQLDERVTATHKLALLCFADSGSAETRIAMPGLETLLRWTCAKKSWALEVVNDLVEWQLLARHKRAHRGQRAEYIVFPNGCCERHGLVPADVRTVEPVELVESAETNGSGGADPLFDGALSTVSAVLADPIDAMGPVENPLMGPPETSNGSGGDPVMGPVATLKTGALQVLPPEQPPTATTTSSGTCPQQPFPSRARSVVDMDFTRVNDPPAGVRIAPPNGGRALGCRHCDAGWICDADGLPTGHCQHCHPAFRPREGTA